MADHNLELSRGHLPSSTSTSARAHDTPPLRPSSSSSSTSADRIGTPLAPVWEGDNDEDGTRSPTPQYPFARSRAPSFSKEASTMSGHHQKSTIDLPPVKPAISASSSSDDDDAKTVAGESTQGKAKSATALQRQTSPCCGRCSGEDDKWWKPPPPALIWRAVKLVARSERHNLLRAYIHVPIGVGFILVCAWGMDLALPIPFPAPVIVLVVYFAVFLFVNWLSPPATVPAVGPDGTRKHVERPWVRIMFRIIGPPCEFLLRHMGVFFTPSFILIPARDTRSPREIGLITGSFVVTWLMAWCFAVLWYKLVALLPPFRASRVGHKDDSALDVEAEASTDDKEHSASDDTAATAEEKNEKTSPQLMVASPEMIPHSPLSRRTFSPSAVIAKVGGILNDQPSTSGFEPAGMTRAFTEPQPLGGVRVQPSRSASHGPRHHHHHHVGHGHPHTRSGSRPRRVSRSRSQDGEWHATDIPVTLRQTTTYSYLPPFDDMWAADLDPKAEAHAFTRAHSFGDMDLVVRPRLGRGRSTSAVGSRPTTADTISAPAPATTLPEGSTPPAGVRSPSLISRASARVRIPPVHLPLPHRRPRSAGSAAPATSTPSTFGSAGYFMPHQLPTVIVEPRRGSLAEALLDPQATHHLTPVHSNTDGSATHGDGHVRSRLSSHIEPLVVSSSRPGTRIAPRRKASTRSDFEDGHTDKPILTSSADSAALPDTDADRGRDGFFTREDASRAIVEHLPIDSTPPRRNTSDATLVGQSGVLAEVRPSAAARPRVPSPVNDAGDDSISAVTGALKVQRGRVSFNLDEERGTGRTVISRDHALEDGKTASNDETPGAAPSSSQDEESEDEETCEEALAGKLVPWVDPFIYFILFCIGLVLFFTADVEVPAASLPLFISINVLTYLFSIRVVPVKWTRVLHPILVTAFFTEFIVWGFSAAKGLTLREGLLKYSSSTTYIELWRPRAWNGPAPGAGDILVSCLEAGIVALSIALFRYRHDLRDYALQLSVVIIPNCALGLLLWPVLARAFGLEVRDAKVYTGRFASTPLAIEVTSALGGDEGLTVVLVVVTGIVAVLLKDVLFKLLRVHKDDFLCIGTTMGVISGAIGTSSLLRTNPRAMAISSVTFALYGGILLIAVSIPPLANFVASLAGGTAAA